ncbi:hypothetical protein CYMTET_47586 [Cymbomonas tetramitiformis]|uniref:Serine-threonine/tyrosine-protein kinase catalytic domain-containing protein n=1 Tax=Cymbomonas tetramitiformis TaxID=36881 RepID=A0AAE0EWJ7_9CHLO|nr:hypothetical protein CYMTET_47586 [Cymbomonas tetramitiformis]
MVAVEIGYHGMRLDQPAGCSPQVAQLMRDCWLEEPLARPSFIDIMDRLANLKPGDMVPNAMGALEDAGPSHGPAGAASSKDDPLQQDPYDHIDAARVPLLQGYEPSDHQPARARELPPLRMKTIAHPESDT